MLGTVATSRLLGGEETGGQLSLVELSGPPGTGPGAHVDPWRETFYVLEGELRFLVERDGAVYPVSARQGDAVTIPAGVGHSFSVSGQEPARYLIASTAAGIDAFFADAGDPIDATTPNGEPPAFNRDRLLAAFEKHGLSPYRCPAGSAG